MQKANLINKDDKRFYNGIWWIPDKVKKRFIPSIKDNKYEKDLKREIWKTEVGDIRKDHQVYLYRTDYSDLSLDNLFCCPVGMWKETRIIWECQNGFRERFIYKIYILDHRDKTFSKEGEYGLWEEASDKRSDLNKRFKHTTKTAILTRD